MTESRMKENVEWMTNAVNLVLLAGLGPVSDRDVDLLLLYKAQGYTVARAVKATFSIRWAYQKLNKAKQGAKDAISRN